MIGKLSLVVACAVVGSYACPPIQNSLGLCGLGLGPLNFGLCGCNLPLGPCGLNFPSTCGLGLGCLLPSCPSSVGPCPTPLPIIAAPPVVIPDCSSPIIELPTPPLPATRVLDNKCVCTKTVVKPQVIQRVVKVPSVKRFLKKSYTPVCEKIRYVSNPVNACDKCGGSCGLGSCCGSCGLRTCCGSCGLGLPCCGSRGLGLPCCDACGLGLQCPGSCGLPCADPCALLPFLGSCAL